MVHSPQFDQPGKVSIDKRMNLNLIIKYMSLLKAYISLIN